jgi:hypothetical protein
MKRLLLLFFTAVFFIAACQDNGQPTRTELRIELLDGNVRRTYISEERVSVDEFLRQANIVIGDLDRIEPSRFTQLEDGMTITIVRGSEETTCYEEDYSFETRRIPTDSLNPGEEVIGQAGENGVQRICERCIFENGVRTTCSVTSQTPIKEAVEQIIYYGTGGVDVPILFEGKLAYISNGQAWFIEGNTRNRRALTTEGLLDGRVFELSPNGRQLLYTRFTDDKEDLEFTNELWAILDTGNPSPVRLLPDNVLTAQWMPGESFSVSYSTANPTNTFPGYEAYNDVYIMRINSQTGQSIDFRNVVEENALGAYSFWGTRYQWSPDGTRLAWSRADSVGLVNLDDGEYVTLLSFPEFAPALSANWVWQPEIQWSYDGRWLITTVHGAPYSTESPENSIIFDMAVIAPDTGLLLDKFLSRTGIWATPRFSPIRQDAAGFPDFDIAYLQARDPLNSLGGEYDLIVADRDGSNPRKIFPPDGRPGIRPFNEKNTDFVWSPSGTHVALIYQGNLWIVEVLSGLNQQITIDGQASHPRWAN